MSIAPDGSIDLVFFRRMQAGQSTVELVHARATFGALPTETTIRTGVLLPTDVHDLRLALVRAANGSVHVLWTGGDFSNPTIEYAVQAASGGSFQVSSVGVGTGASLAVDANGVPHVAYVKDDTNVVTYATRPTSSWTSTSVGATSIVSLTDATAITVDSTGRPSIAFADYTARKLAWAQKTQTGFAIEEVSDAPAVTTSATIALFLHTDEEPIVVHNLDDFSRLHQDTRTGGQWTSTLSAVGGGTTFALAVASTGALWTATYGEDRAIGNGIKVFGGDRSGQLIAQQCSVTQQGLALQADGKPVVAMACSDGISGGLVLMRPTGGDFSEAWHAACDGAVQAICAAGCGCAAAGECCIGSSCFNDYACELNMRGKLCGDPAADESAIVACVPNASSGACNAERWQVDPSCESHDFDYWP